MKLEEIMAMIGGGIPVQFVYSFYENEEDSGPTWNAKAETHLPYMPQMGWFAGDFFVMEVNMLPDGVRVELEYCAPQSEENASDEIKQALHETPWEFEIIDSSESAQKEQDAAAEGGGVVVTVDGKGPAETALAAGRNIFSEEAHAQRQAQAEEAFEKEVVQNGEDGQS